MKLKTLLIGLMILVISFQTFALHKAQYYPTGEVAEVDGYYVDGRLSKLTFFHKTGEVEGVEEYVDGRLSKATIYYKTGEVKEVDEYVDGRSSKATVYWKRGDVYAVQEYIDGNIYKTTHYRRITGEVKKVDEYVDGRLSKETSYREASEAKKSGEPVMEYVHEYVNGRFVKNTSYYKTGDMIWDRKADTSKVPWNWGVTYRDGLGVSQD